MNIINCSNCVYSSADKSMIDCVIQISNTEFWPYTAYINDSSQFSVSLYNDIKNGKYGTIGDYVPRPIPEPKTANT